MRVHHFFAIAALVATTTMCGGGGSSTGPSNSAGTASGTGTPDDPYYSGSGTGNGCGSVATGTVCIGSDLTFNPVSVTVTSGSTVTFTNGTGVTHNVTFDAVAGAPANVADFSSGTKSVTFATPGTYPYHCAIHGLSMHGTVVVQ